MAPINRLQKLAREYERLVGSNESFSEPWTHKIRVTIRRIESCIQLLKPKGSKSLRHELRAVRRSLGQLRELDIALEDARHYDIETDSLVKMRRRVLRVARKQVKPKRLRARFKSLRGLEFGGERDLRSKRAYAIGRVLTAIAQWQRRAPRFKAEWHSLRVDMKKARYALEAMGFPVLPLRKLQDHLGRAHDLEVLQKWVGAHPAVKRDEGVERDRARAQMQPAIQFIVRKLDPMQAIQKSYISK